jgi:uncharacterized protein (UPF0335 family)
MSEPSIGHNSEPATKFAKDQLKSIIERIERLEEEKKTISDDIRDVYAESKGNGYDVKALRTIVRMRKQDPNERAEHETSSSSYLQALVVERLTSEVGSQIACIEGASNYGDTPIECLLFGSVILSLKYFPQEWFTQALIASDESMERRLVRPRAEMPAILSCNLFTPPCEYDFCAELRHNVAGLEGVDFVIYLLRRLGTRFETKSRPAAWMANRLIVECDGSRLPRTHQGASRSKDRASAIACRRLAGY